MANANAMALAPKYIYTIQAASPARLARLNLTDPSLPLASRFLISSARISEIPCEHDHLSPAGTQRCFYRELPCALVCEPAPAFPPGLLTDGVGVG